MTDYDEKFSEAVDKQRDNPAVRRVVHEERVLEPLRNDVAWQHLQQKIGAGRELALTGISRRLMAGEVVEQREIDYTRGYYQGAADLLQAPDRAAANLEREARKAYKRAEHEATQNVTKEESSPYA